MCEPVDSRQASLLSFSSLPKREAKRGEATAFNRGAEKRWRQKAQIKQMPESGLESQPMVMCFECERNAAGTTHLCLSVARPHRCTPSQHSAQLQGHEHWGASSCADPVSFWYVWVWMCPSIICCSCFVIYSMQKLALTSTWNLSLCSFPANNKSQLSLVHQHTPAGDQFNSCPLFSWSFMYPLICKFIWKELLIVCSPSFQSWDVFYTRRLQETLPQLS